MNDTIRVNRAPVLTMWSTMVTERHGFDHATAQMLGQAVAGSRAFEGRRSQGLAGVPSTPFGPTLKRTGS